MPAVLARRSPRPSPSSGCVRSRNFASLAASCCCIARMPVMSCATPPSRSTVPWAVALGRSRCCAPRSRRGPSLSVPVLDPRPRRRCAEPCGAPRSSAGGRPGGLRQRTARSDGSPSVRLDAEEPERTGAPDEAIVRPIDAPRCRRHAEVFGDAVLGLQFLESRQAIALDAPGCGRAGAAASPASAAATAQASADSSSAGPPAEAAAAGTEQQRQRHAGSAERRAAGRGDQGSPEARGLRFGHRWSGRGGCPGSGWNGPRQATRVHSSGSIRLGTDEQCLPANDDSTRPYAARRRPSGCARWLGGVPAGAPGARLRRRPRAARAARAAHGARVVAADRDAGALAAIDACGGTHRAPTSRRGPGRSSGRRFDAVVCCNYLFRPRLDLLSALVAPGGLLVYETFALGNERYGRPANPDFLLRAGRAARAPPARPDCTVLAFEHGFVARAEARDRAARLRDPAARGGRGLRLPVG